MSKTISEAAHCELKRVVPVQPIDNKITRLKSLLVFFSGLKFGTLLCVNLTSSSDKQDFTDNSSQLTIACFTNPLYLMYGVAATSWFLSFAVLRLYQFALEEKAWEVYYDRVLSSWKGQSAFWYHENLRKANSEMGRVIKELRFGQLKSVMNEAIRESNSDIPFVRVATTSITMGSFLVFGFLFFVCFKL